MTSFREVYAALRKKNLKQYVLLAACCFLSVLLITAFVCIMRSPTVLSVLPEGGDSRKQVNMIFTLAILGCGVFTTYASGLFFRFKSRETGVFMALGASKKQLGKLLTAEVAVMSLLSCLAGAILGGPLAWLIWRLFRLLIVDTQEMSLLLDPQAFLYALGFSAFVIVMMFAMLFRFIRRTNIMDVVNEARRSEPFKAVPRYYGWLGIALAVGGLLLGYMAPSFFVLVLHWYAPEGVTAIPYLPAFFGLYMILLHTVANGWRGGKKRYKNIISVGMMKFQGRQTVRNMLVLTVLVAGAYFAAFYTPMLSSGAMMAFDNRKTDYAFHYRADQDMPTREEIEQMAAEENVVITSYMTAPAAVLGVDGEQQIESEAGFGATYTMEYREMVTGASFLSESAYNALTGEAIDIPAGKAAYILDDGGEGEHLTETGITLVTNPITREVLPVEQLEEPIYNSMLLARQVLDDADYEVITAGLTDEWREEEVFFNVENVNDTYPFATRLFYSIADRSTPEVAMSYWWNPIGKLVANERGEDYFADAATLDYALRDSSEFRMFWKYMPTFRVLDREDHVRNTAVFLMQFVFVAIVCFAAVFVIAYTRSITIALSNAQVYRDLRRLGASDSYLRRTIRGQISKVFFVPIFTGTAMISAFYAMILFFNGGADYSPGEMAGMASCLAVVIAMSAVIYAFYRMTLQKVCTMLGIRAAASSQA